MTRIYGLLFMIWIALEKIMNSESEILSIASLLGVLCLFLVKERFLDKWWMSVLFLLIVVGLSPVEHSFLILACIPVVDFMRSGKLGIALPSIVFVLGICLYAGDTTMSLLVMVSALFGYVLGNKEHNEGRYTILLDEERRLRYHLEQAQRELIHSRKEIEHLTRIKERNRIAHELHDTIGHSIAGVLFQIEAAKRLARKDPVKLDDILLLCRNKLAEALELIRKTVHNINTGQKAGPERLEKLANDFRYCDVSFEYKGSFDQVSASNMEVLEKLMMESLTNAAKHSKAQCIAIRIEIGRKYIRYYYKDDGVGCDNIIAHLGISGMQDRVRNAGGTIAVNGHDGFVIVCHLPVSYGMEREDEEHEDFNRG